MGICFELGMLIICFAMIKYGAEKVRTKYINIPETELYIGKWWNVCIKYVSPISIVIMCIWWIVQSIGWYPDSWWNPFIDYSVMTVVMQVGIAITVLILLNDKIADRVENKYITTVADGYPEIPDEHDE